MSRKTLRIDTKNEKRGGESDMKRYLACLLAIVIALSLAGCGAGGQTTGGETETADIEKPTAGSTAPQTFNDWSEAYEDFVLNERFLEGNGNWGDVVEYAVFLHDLDADGTPELGISNGYSGGQTYVYWYYNGGVRDYAWDVPTDQCYYIPDSEYQGIWDYSQGLSDEKTWCYSYKEITEEGNETFGTQIVCKETISNGYVRQSTQDNALFAEFSKEKLPLPYVTISQIKTMGWNNFVQNGAAIAGQSGNSGTSGNALGTLHPTSNHQTISMAGSLDATLVIKEDGAVWGWGYNSFLVEPADLLSVITPTKLMEDAVSVDAGVCGLAITQDNSLWAWGSVYSFTDDRITVPTKIMDNVIAVSAGDAHVLVLQEDGTVWTWGFNMFGSLGDGTTENRSDPIKVMDDAVAISAGGYHNLAVMSDGSLWAWGDNTYGQLGNGSSESSYIPIKIMDNVVSVSAGGGCSLVIKDDGSLWQLGKTSNKKVLDNVVAASAGGEGDMHYHAITSDGSLWSWGDNTFGQLGDGTTINQDEPIKVMDDVIAVNAGMVCCIALKSDGSLWGWGKGQAGTLLASSIGKNYISTPTRIMDGIKTE